MMFTISRAEVINDYFSSLEKIMHDCRLNEMEIGKGTSNSNWSPSLWDDPRDWENQILTNDLNKKREKLKKKKFQRLLRDLF